MKDITVALAGNPNSGKTTVFNELTGMRHHVGNYPGVTVERKEGVADFEGTRIRFVDLPGTYSLTAYSEEERAARHFLIEERPDIVVDIIDSSNLERNLYLATQLMELNVPLVLAFNMSDVAERRGLVFANDQLSVLLRAPIVPLVASKGKGIDKLKEVIVKTAGIAQPEGQSVLHYGREVEEELGRIEALIEREEKPAGRYGSRWLAIKLLEHDEEVLEKVQSREVAEAVERSSSHLRKIFGDDPEVIIADRRYGFISGACEETVTSTVESRHTASDIADKIILNRALGLPIFLALMYLVFALTFEIGNPLVGVTENFFGWLSATVAGFWPASSQSLLKSLIVDGMIAGVGGVLTFVPTIMLLFLAIAILEDSGYMARAAFVMDHIMHKIGLHGKSFIPMLIGFGCSVPAIMATRTLENRRSRLTTIMVVPLMSCSARLPIYVLITQAFFPEELHGIMIWSMYLIGIVIAVIVARILRVTVLRGETIPFVMELPPYRIPTLKGVVIHMWDRAWMYIKKAGTIILVISIILWAAGTFPKPPEKELAGLDAQEARQVKVAYSLAGRTGRTLEPALKPLGFDWKIGTALIGALGAKEMFVAQMGIVNALGETEAASKVLRGKLRNQYSGLTGFCIMLFCLISAPCVATLAICKKETGSWKWALFQYGGLTALAYIVTLVVYQVGMLFA